MVTGVSSAPWRWALWDLVIATVVATVSVQYRSVSPQDMLIGLAMAVALVFRRYSPNRVMAGVSALALLQVFVCPGISTGYDVAVLVAMAAVVIHGRELWHGYVAGAIMVVGVLIVAVDRVVIRSGPAFGIAEFGDYAALLIACVALWLVAYVLRSNREKAEAIADRAATGERERAHLARLAVVEERAVIARELHDVVAHGLAVMIVQADGASFAIDRDKDRAREAMRVIAGTGRDALEDMQHIVALLRGTEPIGPAVDRQVGLGQLETLAGRARAAGLEVDLCVHGEPLGLSFVDELTIVRLAQEGLTNSLRHAGPGAKVAVTLRFHDDTAVVEVVDDGGGRATDPGSATVGGSGGNGLVGMRERVAVYGGEFTAGPRSGSGWRIRAVIPVRAAA
ncbi:sensor histidine kinase [Micromonospora sp. NBC_01412]|uniref:sensor histidine kinase n=1 Tax=Micromonospora sp. NBC_01412 TaxID=2903590 RepID=UPI00324BBD00